MRVPPLVNYWMPAIAWMILIFVGSTDVLSAEHTSRFLVPFLRWIDPSISAAQLGKVQYFIRKCGHLSEYAVLGLLAWNARCRMGGAERKTFRECAKFALVLAAFYAATDEFHQSFVPGREAAVLDVLIDTCGAAIGLALLWGLGRLRKVW